MVRPKWQVFCRDDDRDLEQLVWTHGDYRYDGPLAIIKFDSNEGEFGYDRQHASPHMVKAAPARKRREAKAFVDPTAPLDAWVAEKRNNP